jgi:hypothetical protein
MFKFYLRPNLDKHSIVENMLNFSHGTSDLFVIQLDFLFGLFDFEEFEMTLNMYGQQIVSLLTCNSTLVLMAL